MDDFVMQAGVYWDKLVGYIDAGLAWLNAQPWINRGVLASAIACLFVYWKVKKLIKLLFFAGILVCVYLAARFYGVV